MSWGRMWSHIGIISVNLRPHSPVKLKFWHQFPLNAAPHSRHSDSSLPGQYLLPAFPPTLDLCSAFHHPNWRVLESSRLGAFMWFLLSAEYAFIPKPWKKTTVPTIREWVEESNLIMRMEALTASLHDRYLKFRTLWYFWINFSTSSKHQHSYDNL